MKNETIQQTKTALLVLLIFTILTGLLYPMVVTWLAQALFQWQANGSLIQQNNQVIGSSLIGQSFTDSRYFWGRPSATSPFPYNAESSSGSNMGPLNPDFLETMKNRLSIFEKSDPHHQLIPVDLVTASGSGLDPEISPLAAMYQVSRIAKTRHLPEKDVEALIQRQIKNRFLMILGEPRINVLQLNLALDSIKPPIFTNLSNTGLKK